ncbi:MAG TPA: hypothetical protein VKB02_01970 [Pyrinomonadaceae bacterium]|nr:hypothetical protein [Pyrinomonadaceae bacterium]
MTDSTSHSAGPGEPDPDFIRWFREYSVPIASVIAGVLLSCLIGHYSSARVDWTRTKDFTEAFGNVTQTLALIAGGVWAYFKFAKGRTFRDRLTPTVSGKFLLVSGSVFLFVETQIKNVGLSRITIDHEASSLILFECIPSKVGEILSVRNVRLISFQVFGDKDRYIEPNEIIERQRLITLPRVSDIGYQLEFEVLTNAGYEWRATSIVDRSTFEDNELG